MKGHLYILQAEDGLVKIGISRNPGKRISEVRTASGREFVRVFVSPAIEAFAELEGRLHKHFGRHCRNGEWFSITFEEAMAAADELGLSIAGETWVDADRYLRGVTARNRLRGFIDSGATDAELAAFVLGMGEADTDARYADMCDMRAAGKALNTRVSLTVGLWGVGSGGAVEENAASSLDRIEGEIAATTAAMRA